MPNNLSIDLPYAAYESLRNMAAAMGRLPEELAAEWLAATIQRINNDPLVRLSSAVASEVTDTR